ncbi:MAG: hypothetical protein VX976_03645 [Pseudomonadota bacterium]|nr:hypothetical protein [Pseudomonadota bacterium]
MLSDRFVNDKEHFEDQNLSQQIKRLEELSVSMSDLMNNGNSEKIVHLERVRQKILRDIIKKKEPITDNIQPKISNLINLNNKMIKDMEEKKDKSLGAISKKVKFYKSYREF